MSWNRSKASSTVLCRASTVPRGAVERVGQAVPAAAQATQLDRPVPPPGVERVVQGRALRHHMRLGLVETDVVQLAPVLARGQHVLLVQVHPPAPEGFPLRREHDPLVRARGVGELRRQYGSHTVAGGEVVAAVAQFDVVAGVAAAPAHQRLHRLALRTDLVRGERVRARVLVDVGEVVEGEGGAAGAEFDDGVAVRLVRGLVHRLPEPRETLGRLLGAGVPVCRVVAGRDGVEVLAVDLEPFVSPVADEPLHLPDEVVHRRPVRGAQGPGVPPAHALLVALTIQQEHVGVVPVQAALRVRRQRSPPQARPQAGVPDLPGEGPHVRRAPRELPRVQLPVALVGLPAVVEHRPLEADLTHLGERGDDLLDGEVPLVAPGTPHGFQSRFGRPGRTPADVAHVVAVALERCEVVAGQGGQERGVGGQAPPRPQGHGGVALDGEARSAGRPAYRQAQHPGHGFDVPDGETGPGRHTVATGVPPP